jgi:hypothetical protein
VGAIVRPALESEPDMLDLVFLALGVGIFLALGFYARAIGKL